MVSPYSDGSAYDALVTDHMVPSIYADDDEHQRTPRSARAEFFSELRGSDMAASRPAHGDVPATVSAPPSCGDPSSLSARAGLETTNVSGARQSPGAA